MEKTMSMMDYILETDTLLQTLIHESQATFAPMLAFIKDMSIHQIYLLGSGTSCHAGWAVKSFLEEVLGKQVIPMFPMIFADQEKAMQPNSLIIGISQSGKSLSTMQALDYAREQGFKTIAIVGEPDSEMEKHADHIVFMDCGVEKAVAKTKGYTATVLTLFLMGLEWAYAQGKIMEEQYLAWMEDLRETALQIPAIIEESTKWYEKHQAALIGCNRVIVVGSGHQYGTMLEGALKLLECVRMAVSGYELEEFMHGVYNSIRKDTCLLYIADGMEKQERMMRLCQYLKQVTPMNYLITNAKYADEEADLAVSAYNHARFNVLEYIIPFQVLSYRLAIDRGIDPTKPSDPKFHQNMQSKLV